MSKLGLIEQQTPRQGLATIRARGFEYIFTASLDDIHPPPLPSDDWLYGEPKSPWGADIFSPSEEQRVVWMSVRRLAGPKPAGPWSPPAVIAIMDP